MFALLDLAVVPVVLLVAMCLVTWPNAWDRPAVVLQVVIGPHSQNVGQSKEGMPGWPVGDSGSSASAQQELKI